ncbi:HET-domain-containing protein [Whalleya microplaca]|nr:HET-domain-containing protein [Whalleya microplaca]
MDTPPTSPTSEYLCDANSIDKAIVICANKHELSGNGFMPADHIKALLTTRNIKRILESSKMTPTFELLNFIQYKANKVFLTLVVIGDITSIVEFKANDLQDEDLPVGRVIKGSTPKERSRVIESLDETTKSTSRKCWPFLARWKPSRLNSFLVQQWQFLAPTFGKASFYQSLDKNRPLPFVEVTEGLPPEGNFSSVYRVEIHEAHADPEVFDTLSIAVKVFKPGLGEYFDRERARLEIIRHLHHPHLIRPLAAYEHGIKQCFMFPWADGGNLRDYWKRTIRNEAPILWTLSQMSGICDCLRLLWRNNCRHGDLKPENILLDRRENFIIADVGLSKFHIDGTERRDRHSSMKYRTHRYEAPEISQYKSDKPISRDSDMWPMGIILLEWITWLIYGNERLIELNGLDLFWERLDNAFRVNRIAREWMEEMTRVLPKDTAIRDILDLIRTRLLVVNLASDNEKLESGRAKAEELAECVGNIAQRAQHDPLYSTPVHKSVGSPMKATLRQKHGAGTTNNIIPSITLDHAEDTLDRQVVSLPRDEYKESNNRKWDNAWASEPDNDFARGLFRKVEWDTLRPSYNERTLCVSCKAIDIWSEGVQISYCMSELKGKSSICHVCQLFYRSLLEHGIGDDDKGKLIRVSSNFEEESIGIPIISVYLDPEIQVPSSHHGQLGFPQLPKPWSPAQLTLLREWLRNCNETHECRHHESPNTVRRMPTRLIDVGSCAKPDLRLVETAGAIKANYIALSHCWGMIDEPFKFCTYRSNIKELIQEGIDFSRLPKTFQDSIEVTRYLGVQYLWIDSLCIIQKDKDDWEAEVGSMESVFSFAYCTIAASSAASHKEGLIYARQSRPCIGVQDQGSEIYLCQAIDNFHADVEEAILNTRGWVLQERALSRRTIHFTSNQIYWECGKGVHCETLAKLHNPQAAFLGDSFFPNAVLQYWRDGRIGLLQELYGTYSKLDFKEITDRSMGILGLERRLARTLETDGDYGILNRYLHRSLLWSRHGSARLQPIAYPDDRTVPSWSWMAYKGEISYIDAPFGSVDWSSDDIKYPFDSGPRPCPSERRAGKPTPEIVALARHLNFRDDPIEIQKRIVLDEVTVENINTLRCIVLGKDKHRGQGKSNHYVLVIKLSTPRLPTGPYLRVGIGSLLASHISKGPGEWVHIQ